MEDKEKQIQELEAKLAELKAQEAKLDRKERMLRAKEALSEAGLPGEILKHLNLTSDETLENDLALAREIRGLPQDSGPGTPKAGIARLPRDAGYAQRAHLYQTDRNAYYEQFKGENQ